MESQAQESASIRFDRQTDWHIWQSDGGQYYATRPGRLTDAEIAAGKAMTVAADDPEALCRLLDEQGAWLAPVDT